MKKQQDDWGYKLMLIPLASAVFALVLIGVLMVREVFEGYPLSLTVAISGFFMAGVMVYGMHIINDIWGSD